MQPVKPPVRKKWSGMIIIVLAAIFMEAILGFQYNYARKQLEEELERSTLMDLITSSLYIQEVLSNAEVAVKNEQMHAQMHVHDLDYMKVIIRSLVNNDERNLDGAFVAFQPHFYLNQGYWCEWYARETEQDVELTQLGSATHDYTKSEFYRSVMEDNISQWTDPYVDDDGAHTRVITYAVPITHEGKPIGVLGVDLTTLWINDVVNHYHPHPSSFGLVLTEDGKLISAPSDTSIVSPHMLDKIVSMYNDSTVERKLVGRGRITRFMFYDDECKEQGRVYYARKARSPHWQMLLVCYDSEVFGQIDKLRGYMFLFAMLGLLVLSLIVWQFMKAGRKLRDTELSQERIQTELRVANEIQQSMLPQGELNSDGLKVNGFLKPAKEVGGDLYDYFIRDEKLFFCIGDVSGKGAASAMLMAVTHTLFRSASAHETNPARIMQAINEFTAEGNEKCMFITLFIGVLDLPTGHLRYTNAGHDKPIHLRWNDVQFTVENLPCDANLPVGAFENTKFALQQMTLEPGCMLFLYTDGLTEAKNKHREQFGLKRIEQRLRTMGNRLQEPQALIKDMTDCVHAFVGEAEQSDDLTMLAIHYTPGHFESHIAERLTLTNQIKEVSRLSTFVKTVTAQLNIAPSMAQQLRLAIEEAVVNVIDYAYPISTEGEIEVLMESDDRTLRVVISDHGMPFDPTAKEKADTTLSAEDRQIGGLGILLVREMMDSINYERTNGMNVLTLFKTLK